MKGLHRMPNSDRGIEIGAWMLEHGHRLLLRLTGGRYPKTIAGMKAVELHTVGRKSGKRYSTLLTAPVYEPNRLVVVASKGGHSDHPDWYKNLVATPDIEVTVDEHTVPMRARTATPAEKAELWPAVVKTFNSYGDYQRNTDRDIPLVICEPR
jgi:deazaflavin-dependent oxidoreductase (nitroreductase family)